MDACDDKQRFRDELVKLNVSMSPELDDRLTVLAREGGMTKEKVLAKAIALFDVAARAHASQQHVAILDQEYALVTEIVGI